MFICIKSIIVLCKNKKENKHILFFSILFYMREEKKLIFLTRTSLHGNQSIKSSVVDSETEFRIPNLDPIKQIGNLCTLYSQQQWE